MGLRKLRKVEVEGKKKEEHKSSQEEQQNDGGYIGLCAAEQSRQSQRQWKDAFQFSTHLLMNQWGIDVNELWMNYKDNHKGVSSQSTSVEQRQQVLADSNKRDCSKVAFHKHDAEAWGFIMSGMDVTLMN
eukprot:TRINITY_DN1958_c0_g1_i2.p2 TRINITY_DN1958_c0_g1~~TRINITY_DN1958_c0_g1_i2.p2  ORF type:complete len:130 (-),score=8.92 TRINITY_DN1958_c0_g1_i2:705-1094(-)